jgi:hypothetical protein
LTVAKADQYSGSDLARFCNGLGRKEVVSMAIERQTVVDRTGPSGGELARRVIVLAFGVVQAVIILRIVLLLLNAREANALVSFILDLSSVFVAPFEGVLRTNALSKGGSVFDLAAVVALVGWTVLEGIAIAAVGIFRREPA